MIDVELIIRNITVNSQFTCREIVALTGLDYMTVWDVYNEAQHEREPF